MNNAHKRQQWIGVIGGVGLVLLFGINALNIAAHMVLGHGVLAFSIPMFLIFGAAAVFFGNLTVKKAKYLLRH